MAKTTSDPKVAAGLVEAAADLKDRGRIAAVDFNKTHGPIDGTVMAASKQIALD